MLVRRHVPGLSDPRRSLRRPAFAAAVAFVITAGAKIAIGGPILVEAIIVGTLAVSSYAIIAYRIGIDDARLLLAPIRKLIWR